jgi:hypothetical protein
MSRCPAFALVPSADNVSSSVTLSSEVVDDLLACLDQVYVPAEQQPQ